MIGPPSEPPNVLRITLGGRLDSPARNCACLLNQSLATVMVGRWYSYADPWKRLVPPLVTSETCAPEERPESALEFVVTTRNSCSESRVVRSAPRKAKPRVWSLLSMPSDRKSTRLNSSHMSISYAV